MSAIVDKLKAQARGAGQAASLGWNDEAVARILQALPTPDDGTGIPREYNGGQYEQYRDDMRRDNAESAAKYPRNFGTGQVAGGLAAAGAGGASVPAAVAGGALAGAGNSERAGAGLARDAAAGGAMGGAFGAAGRALPVAGAAIRDIPPPPPQLSPALAGSGTNRVAQQPISSKTANMNFRSETPPSPAGAPSGRPTVADEAATSAALKASPDESAVNQARQSVEPDAFENMQTFPPIPPVDDIASIPIPRQKPMKVVQRIHTKNGEIAEADYLEPAEQPGAIPNNIIKKTDSVPVSARGRAKKGLK